MGMEKPSVLQLLPQETLLYIAALAHNNAAMNLVNKEYAKLITQENVLLLYPQSLTKRDHINFMVKAAKKDDEKKVRLGLKTALACGHDYETIVNKISPNDSAIFFSTIPIAQFKISLKYERNGNDKYFQTLLPAILSVYKGEPATINAYKNLLLFNHPNYKQRFTALHVATQLNHPDIAELLIAQDATLLHQRPYPINLAGPVAPMAMATPLEVAIYKDLPDMYGLFTSYKNIHPDPSLLVDKMLTGGKDLTFLEWVISKKNLPFKNNLPLLKDILNRFKHHYDKEKYLSFFTPQALDLAISPPNTAILPPNYNKIILFLWEEIGYKLPGKTQPLHMAVKKDNRDLIKILCEHPTTDINAQDEDGNTPLLIAAQNESWINNYIWSINYLLTKNADPTIVDKNLRTPLSTAAHSHEIRIIKLLLTTKKVRDTINSQDIEGKTALMLSVDRTTNTKIASLLLAAGADRDIKDNDVKTTYDWAWNDTIKQFLLTYDPLKSSEKH